MKTLLVELFVLAAFLVTLCHSNPKCPYGWIKNKKSCYEFKRNMLNWYEAAAACRQQGGHLVTVDDAEENQFILNQLLAPQNYQYFGIMHYRTFYDYSGMNQDYSVIWIGLTDLYQESNWQWSDTDSLNDYSYWYQGQLPMQDGTLNCAHYGMPSTLQWHAASCFTKGTYICEL